MKKILLSTLGLSFVFLVYEKVYAKDYWTANASSVTSVSATAAYIQNSQMGDVLKRLIIGSCGANTSTVTIYDSSGSANNPITPTINASSSAIAGSPAGDCRQIFEFDLQISSGLTYTSTANIGSAPSIGIYWYRQNKLSTTYP